jgi:hypothetical protein
VTLLAVAAALLPIEAGAIAPAFSRAPATLDLCSSDVNAPIHKDACNEGGYAKVSADLDRALAAALEKAAALGNHEAKLSLK